jgi:hypothetical protein
MSGAICGPRRSRLVGVLTILQLLFFYVPFLKLWFNSAPIPASDWLLSIGIGFAMFLAVEAEKAIPRRLKPLPGAKTSRGKG